MLVIFLFSYYSGAPRQLGGVAVDHAMRWWDELDMFENQWKELALDHKLWKTREDTFAQQWDSTELATTTIFWDLKEFN